MNFRRINGLDLFSGIGGMSIALKHWVRTIAYCENDKYCQASLLSQMSMDNIDKGPIWDDVRTLKGCNFFNYDIDIIFGGFPCQDISVAGTGKGLEGKRSGLFFEIVRLARELNPRFIFLENVPAIRTRGLSTIIQEFTELGYDCRWTVLSAGEVGAPHIRKRWFLLAHSNKQGLEVKQSRKTRKRQAIKREGFWSIEPSVGRVAYGLPNRVDRIKALGNAVVPLQARTAFERLMGLSN